MPVEVMSEFERRFNVRVMEGYGLSETSPLATFNHIERPSKPGTVGQQIFGVDVRCFDDDDKEVPRGTRGEVVIRGTNVMKGYYKRPEATAEAFRSGWFHTGDIGIIDEDAIAFILKVIWWGNIFTLIVAVFYIILCIFLIVGVVKVRIVFKL